jgi:antitoxin (DNA-binding transcriptional repressor) of toxin-antitoxin stability system
MNALAKTVVEEGEARLSDLLDRVQRGEEVTIARQGRPVALMKEPEPDATRAGTVLDDLWSFREEIKAKYGPVATGEILEMIREGRRY